MFSRRPSSRSTLVWLRWLASAAAVAVATADTDVDAAVVEVGIAVGKKLGHPELTNLSANNANNMPIGNRRW
jgi:hypothetical protein